ncbi:hypothetical protein K439DRAFT_915656 [Ramaria rubella]|nr:hypothetical protein K439DRAFT_915656 [Ramaria rubella]
MFEILSGLHSHPHSPVELHFVHAVLPLRSIEPTLVLPACLVPPTNIFPFLASPTSLIPHTRNRCTPFYPCS